MKRHSPEQVIAKLRQAEADLAQGLNLAQVCQKLGVSEPTLHRWRNQYGGLKADEAKRLKGLARQPQARASAVAAARAESAVGHFGIPGPFAVRDEFKEHPVQATVPQSAAPGHPPSGMRESGLDCRRTQRVCRARDAMRQRS